MKSTPRPRAHPGLGSALRGVPLPRNRQQATNPWALKVRASLTIHKQSTHSYRRQPLQTLVVWLGRQFQPRSGLQNPGQPVCGSHPIPNRDSELPSNLILGIRSQSLFMHPWWRANTAWFMTCPIPMTGHRSTPIFHSSRKLSSIVPWVAPSGNYCNCPKVPSLQNAIWRMLTAWFLSTHPSIPSWEYTSRDSITTISVWQWAVEVHAKSSKHLQRPYIISTSSTTQTQATFTCLTTH